MTNSHLVKLSKFMALVLRHQPERFGLPVDDEGWAPLAEVMSILHELPNFRWATRADVMRVVEEGSGDDRRRFEVDAQGQRIRARYGHTLAQPIHYAPCNPPARLYHATSPQAVDAIRREGLKPMSRQYVHLFADPAPASAAGTHHADPPVVLSVRAADAHAAGVIFYRADDVVYLAGYVPPEFLDWPTTKRDDSRG
ncbi:MAG: RNA 2'-phosphotransferase [Anaerolineae bacterium]|nr:RNA 2'-phosphotransferase [Anaerolineae bacterium]